MIIQEALGQGANVIALCDADAKRIDNMRKTLAGKKPDAPADDGQSEGLRGLSQAHRQGESARWRADRHRPLVARPHEHRVHPRGKARLLRKAAHPAGLRGPGVGPTGQAVEGCHADGHAGGGQRTFRRAVEIIQAGLLGQIREVHVWHDNPVGPKSQARPAGEDPIPAGFNWDLWVGPSPLRPYKKDVYQPGCRRTSFWFDFGAGILGDFGVHTWQLPIRALKLDYPIHVEHNVPEPVLET